MTPATLHIHPDTAVDFTKEADRLYTKNFISTMTMTVAAVGAVAITLISTAFALAPTTPVWMIVPIELGSAMALDVLLNRLFFPELDSIHTSTKERENVLSLDERAKGYLSLWNSYDDTLATIEQAVGSSERWERMADIPRDQLQVFAARLLAYFDDAKQKREAYKTGLAHIHERRAELTSECGNPETFFALPEEKQKEARSLYIESESQIDLLTSQKAIWNIYSAYYYSILLEPRVTGKIDELIAPRLLTREEVAAEQALTEHSPFISPLTNFGVSAEYYKKEVLADCTLAELKEHVFDHAFGLTPTV